MPDMSVTVVEGRDLVLAYGARVAIASSSFRIPRGGVTALVGPNGSGKSTLLGAIAGLIDPVAGQLLLDGVDRRRISYVLQTTKVNESLPVTVREVVSMGRYATSGPHRRLGAEDAEAVEGAMVRMGVEGLAGRHLGELSGGQRQRVFVAQGLAQDHDLLLLDEPLTGLDLTSAQAIDQVIHEESRSGGTIVISTHDLAEAMVADHVLLLSGRVVASGPPAEALKLEHLGEAYGPNLLHREGEGLFIDDPAHQPVPGRHLHRDRTG